MAPPLPLKEDDVTNERVKHVIRKIKDVSFGHCYVYQWNVDTVKNPPLGLYIEPEHISTACDAVERYGGRKAEPKDGVVQFDMKDACGIQGNNIVFYKSGKISVTSTEKGKADAPPKFDFCKTVLIDVIDDMSKAIKGSILAKEASAKDPAAEQCTANQEMPRIPFHQTSKTAQSN